MSLKTRSDPATLNLGNTTTLHQHFSPFGENGSVLRGKDREAVRSSILSGGSSASTSSIKGREPIPLTPEILQLLDILESDKGRHARILTENLTGQRTLPSTEQELHTQLERKASRKMKRHQVAAKAAAYKVTVGQIETGRKAPEIAMAAHVAQPVMAAALAMGATIEDAIVAGQAASAAILGEEGTATMQD
jgi:DNA-binding XRE family transcriptional regulator